MTTAPGVAQPDWYRTNKQLAGKIDFDRNPTLTASHLAIPPNVKRRALLLVGPNTGRVTFSNDSPVTIDNGITLTNTAGVVELYFEFVGDAICKPWYAIYAASSTPASWIEAVDGGA